MLRATVSEGQRCDGRLAHRNGAGDLDCFPMPRLIYTAMSVLPLEANGNLSARAPARDPHVVDQPWTTRTARCRTRRLPLRAGRAVVGLRKRLPQRPVGHGVVGSDSAVPDRGHGPFTVPHRCSNG